jgi:hypothetical protein
LHTQLRPLAAPECNNLAFGNRFGENLSIRQAFFNYLLMRTAQQPLHTKIFINVRPMDALAIPKDFIIS